MLNARVIRKKQTNYPRAFAQMQQQFLTAAGLMVEGTAKARVPVDEGRLRGSITSRVRDEQAVVGTNVEYAAHVEYGTKAHRIDSAVYIKRVGWRYIGKHPGTKARPYMRPAIDLNRRKLVILFSRIFDRWFYRGG